MGADGAVNIIFRKEIKSATDAAAEKQRLVDDYREKFANPYKAAEFGYIDDVIDPADTRLQIIQALKMLKTKRDTNPPKKHGISRYSFQNNDLAAYPVAVCETDHLSPRPCQNHFLKLYTNKRRICLCLSTGMELITVILTTQTGIPDAPVGQGFMLCIGLLFLYLAIAKKFEPLLLLVPIGFGIFLVNFPLAPLMGYTEQWQPGADPGIL